MNDAAPDLLVPSREQLVHALHEAAELEHNLMCTYLYAAFIITWVIHGVYLLTLVTRYRKAERELREFQNK